MIANKNIIIFFIFVFHKINSQETVEYFEDVISKAQQDAANFKAPTDARKFKPSATTIKEFGLYGEFIQEGSILEIPKYFYLGLSSDYNWGFKSIPQKTACLGLINKQCIHGRGRGVGGSTLVNDLLYDRGAPGVFDLYAKIVKDRSWSYKNILKYYKKFENFHWTNPSAPVDIKFHGTSGLLDIQNKVPNVKINDIFLQAHRELGLPVTDYNGPTRLGATIAQIYTRNGRRLDMGTAFLKPFLNRTNLNVSTGSYVTKIIFNRNKVAERVIFTKNGSYYTVKANREIILSAGSIQSPQILMLSGVGPRDHLKSHGINVIENLEVGTKFLDQPSTKNFMFSTNYSIVSSSLKEQIQEFLNATGPLTSPHTCQGNGFYRIVTPYRGISDLEVIADISSPGSSDGWKNETFKELWSNTKSSISFSLRNTNPKSFGTVRLNSSDPFEYPLINPNYFADDKNEDIELMYKGILLVFNLTETNAFKQINLFYNSQQLSTCKQYAFKSKNYWYCFLRQVTQSAAHPVGTCSMGTRRNKEAVVDSDLRVFGVKSLRVVDASVFPISTGGHISMPCVMIAEKIADIIKKKYRNNKFCRQYKKFKNYKI